MMPQIGAAVSPYPRTSAAPRRLIQRATRGIPLPHPRDKPTDRLSFRIWRPLVVSARRPRPDYPGLGTFGVLAVLRVFLAPVAG
ncbi:MAG: hypothetical protein ABI870_15405, partial [Rhodanobacter sp.]